MYSEGEKQMKAAIVGLAWALAVSACGREMGHKFDGSAAQLLTPGTTTIEGAIARLGHHCAGRHF